MRDCIKIMLVWRRYGSWGFLNVEVHYLVSIISPSIQRFISKDSKVLKYVKPVKSDEHECTIALRNYRRIVFCGCDALQVADSFDMKQAISYHIPRLEFRDEGTEIIGRSTTVFWGVEN